jgi:type II secretory pathway pseudopilin PulG
MFHYFKKNFSRTGFTITELLISLGILVAIVSVVISNQSTYNEDTSRVNVADEIGLRLVQAQTYGTGVKELSVGSNEFNVGYGLSFSLLNNNNGSPTSYISFADRNANQVYDQNWACPTTASSECLEKVNVSHDNYIEGLCAIRSGNSDHCNIKRIDISFNASTTDAQLKFLNNGGQSFDPGNVTGAKIILKSPSGGNTSVVIYQTGQISVDTGSRFVPPPLAWTLTAA